jgi:beta-galactosidase
MKEFGFNGWRTAHYDHGGEVLNACDELGLLVMAEARHFGNTEESKSPPGPPHDTVPELVEMLKQNRNHPSIIIWSMYNEEKLASTPEGARIFRAMKKETLKHDATRPITGAHYHDFSPNGAPRLMDVLGINYNFKRNGYAKIRERYPNKPFLATETLHERTTRGIYANDPATGWADSYGLSILAWQEIASRPYFAGVYIWTGFDYRGEPNPYGWPAVNNNNGAFDMCGFPKDKAFYLKSCWTTEPMVHLLPMNWNLQGREGEGIRVMAVSNAKEVELFLNGKSLGVKEVPKGGAAEWQVPYATGTLSANAITDGKVVSACKVETTGKPAAIRMFPDRAELKADNCDALVVPISIHDSEGRVVPDAMNRVTFELVGEGRILGVHNGNPSDHDPDRADNRRAFNGYCMVLIQSGAKSGVIKLTATSPGLKPAAMVFTVKQEVVK